MSMSESYKRAHKEDRKLKARKGIYLQYKSGAAYRSVPFTLTFDEFVKLIELPCYYCGQPPSNTFRPGRFEDEISIYQGIDRENNEQGYTRSNSVPCCITCNNMKKNNNFTLLTFAIIASAVTML